MTNLPSTWMLEYQWRHLVSKPHAVYNTKPTIPNPYSNVYGANMGPIWVRQDPGGPHVGPMNFAIGKATKLCAYFIGDTIRDRVFGP